jgi:hypothetical protein
MMPTMIPMPDKNTNKPIQVFEFPVVPLPLFVEEFDGVNQLLIFVFVEDLAFIGSKLFIIFELTPALIYRISIYFRLVGIEPIAHGYNYALF